MWIVVSYSDENYVGERYAHIVMSLLWIQEWGLVFCPANALLIFCRATKTSQELGEFVVDQNNWIIDSTL